MCELGRSRDCDFGRLRLIDSFLHRSGMLLGAAVLAVVAMAVWLPGSRALGGRLRTARSGNIIIDDRHFCGTDNSGTNNGPTGACNDNNVVGTGSLNDNKSSNFVLSLDPSAGS